MWAKFASFSSSLYLATICCFFASSGNGLSASDNTALLESAAPEPNIEQGNTEKSVPRESSSPFVTDTSCLKDRSVILDALAGELCDRNMEVVAQGNLSQNSNDYNANNEPLRHFECDDPARSYKYIEREQTNVLNFAGNADKDPDSRTRALYHFGRLLHTLQDFYMHTNYVELALRVKSDNDPYSLALFDWVNLSGDGAVTIGGETLRRVPIGDTRRHYLDRAIGDTTIARLARGLAVEEIIRQWSYLENLLRRKYGERATLILAALKQAHCEKVEPEEVSEIFP